MNKPDETPEPSTVGSELNERLGVKMDPLDKPLTPVERLAVKLTLGRHADDADALLRLDFLMDKYLATSDPLTEDAEELRDMLLEVVESWLPKDLQIVDA